MGGPRDETREEGCLPWFGFLEQIVVSSEPGKQSWMNDGSRSRISVAIIHDVDEKPISKP